MNITQNIMNKKQKQGLKWTVLLFCSPLINIPPLTLPSVGSRPQLHVDTGRQSSMQDMCTITVRIYRDTTVGKESSDARL